MMFDSTVQSAPDYSHEAELKARGARIVAGVDEAGRGPLAGPVVVAAVVLDPDAIPAGLNDSKKLNQEQREALFEHVVASALAISVVVAPPSIILSHNIRGATLWGMAQAACGLSIRPDRVLIDGRDVPMGLPCDGMALIGGDGRSVSIAAASIVAKVTRDRMCAIMDCDAPAFGFAGHKGYGTARHMTALSEHGPCRHHREAFGPVAQARLRLTALAG
ncbi:ribonuclease HII [Devosia litorisediminis]|jgi:ribonuclease HII|uniref:Ribonuclease HII n=1 Tax=Devosia litorisediminis TaxID=2829817 RepID=A0A942I5S0_9HYPH|nr:ribonuclease HII [Devosia litorisediminis]MBS3849336.1 ribonuclease HII [Devosia litorisediminis]|tara:strand:- start:3013 stop:3669 length:657 start_codon:yes stop_codon:yes gene_type:complete